MQILSSKYCFRNVISNSASVSRSGSLDLAENAFEDEAVQKDLDGETIAELADEIGPISTARRIPTKIALVIKISSLVSIFKQATGMGRINLICFRLL